MSRTFKPLTHQVQWRKRNYWAPGPSFSSEEQAIEYAEVRAVPEKLGVYRVVPVTQTGELSVEQCLALMKLIQMQPKHWRAFLCKFISKFDKPKGVWTDDELQCLQDVGQRFPANKLSKLNVRQLRNKLEMADARERAAAVVSEVQHVVALDKNPDVMTVEEGAFVQAWVFVPKRTEEQKREREYDIAAYLAGQTGPVTA